MAEWLQYLIMVVIIGGIALAIFRGGAANPEGTASLRTAIAKLEGRLKAVETQVKHAASTSDINVLRAEMAGDRAIAQDTKRAVDRIEDILIKNALGGRG